MSSKTRVAAKVRISVNTTSGESAQGLAASCASNSVRVAAWRERNGITGCNPRTSRIDAPIVVRKNRVSQPRQNPPGSRATQWPPTPRRESSRTRRPPTELPTISTRPSRSPSMNSIRASAKAEMVWRSGTGGDRPCPGMSTRINSRETLSAATIVSQERTLPPSPWTMSRGRPAPRCSEYKAMRTQRAGGRTVHLAESWHERSLGVRGISFAATQPLNRALMVCSPRWMVTAQV